MSTLQPALSQPMTTPSADASIIPSVRPSWLDPYIKGSGIVEYGGKRYRYDIISREPANRQQAPHFFTIGPAGGVLAVSETVPEEFRRIALLHEFIEHHECSGPLCCRIALERELALLQECAELDQRAYIDFRLDFFSQTIGFYTRKGSRITMKERELVAQMHQSYMYLKDTSGT